ncbi:MAG: NCS2 family permease, partial [Rhodospirillaceae bacterium]|nr:NCS2 family permease [Rhodospirillaceae bacterium]
VIFAFFVVDLFDSAGTLIGTAHVGGFLNRDGRLPRLREALLADSAATVAGACLGTSPVTAYIESVSGIRAGGRTGLTAVVVAVLFLLMLFFAPVAAMVPSYAAAPALIYVGCLMAKSLTDIDWTDLTEYTPAVITAVSMPLTFSITHGLGFGFVSYAAIKVATGQAHAVSKAVYLIAAAFVVFFALN